MNTSDLEEGPVLLDAPVAVPQARLSPDFLITAGGTRVAGLFVEGTPVDDLPTQRRIVEVFVEHGDLELQLTNFGRSDTANPLLDLDQQRVLFLALGGPVRDQS